MEMTEYVILVNEKIRNVSHVGLYFFDFSLECYNFLLIFSFCRKILILIVLCLLSNSLVAKFESILNFLAHFK